MKKSTLLSLATVGTIVATSIGTFAAWDTTTASISADVTLGNPVTVTAGDFNNLSAETRTLGADPTYTSTVTFNVSDAGGLANTLTLTPTLKDSNGDAVDSSKATVELSQTADATFTNNTDTALEDGTNTYQVKVTVLDNSLKGETLTVDVAAALSKTGA